MVLVELEGGPTSQGSDVGRREIRSPVGLLGTGASRRQRQVFNRSDFDQICRGRVGFVASGRVVDRAPSGAGACALIVEH